VVERIAPLKFLQNYFYAELQIIGPKKTKFRIIRMFSKYLFPLGWCHLVNLFFQLVIHVLQLFVRYILYVQELYCLLLAKVLKVY
jgi:hypothetical protein